MTHSNSNSPPHRDRPPAKPRGEKVIAATTEIVSRSRPFSVPDALRRRREASRRMSPLADGRRDPWSDHTDAPDELANALASFDDGDWAGEDYYAPPWPDEREKLARGPE